MQCRHVWFAFRRSSWWMDFFGKISIMYNIYFEDDRLLTAGCGDFSIFANKETET